MSFKPVAPKPKRVIVMDKDCEMVKGGASTSDCGSMFNCCNCGDNDCGCAYCFSCRACDHCKESD